MGRLLYQSLFLSIPRGIILNSVGYRFALGRPPVDTISHPTMSDLLSFTLGNALVEPAIHRITLGDTSTKVEPRIMKVLMCLVEHAGQVVERDVLIQAAWPDGHSSDEGLTKVISYLRKALGDKARNACIIETIPKRGYRLKAPVFPVIQVPPAPKISDPTTLPHQQGIPLPKPGTQIKWLWSAIVVLFCMVVGQGYYYHQSQHAQAKESPLPALVLDQMRHFSTISPESLRVVMAPHPPQKGLHTIMIADSTGQAHVSATLKTNGVACPPAASGQQELHGSVIFTDSLRLSPAAVSCSDFSLSTLSPHLPVNTLTLIRKVSQETEVF